jgi:hypothetical protein
MVVADRPVAALTSAAYLPAAVVAVASLAAVAAVAVQQEP